ncbi:MAG TPA: hypothetical protein VFU02_21255, partial [Polyangiaceae bacterium]|nr:hypothetical protein [Polyangiaceae bacterium]
GLTPSVGRAEQKTLLLVHRTPEAGDCPDAAALAQQVHAIVGREVIGTSSEPASAWIEVTMTRLKQGYFANVHTFGSNVGRRDISDSGDDCSGLAEAVALSLALMWSSQEAAPSEEAAPVIAPSEPPPTSSPPLAAPSDSVPRKAQPRRVAKPPPPPPRPQSVSLGVEALVGAAVEVLAHPVPNAELGARLAIGERIGFGLGAGALGIDRLETEPGVVELSLGYAYFAACVGITRSTPSVSLCLRPMLGMLRGDGQQFERSHSESVFYAALSAGGELRGRLLGSAGYVARVMGVAPLTRSGFSVSDTNGAEPVFTPPAVGLLAAIGASWGDGHD